MTDEIEDYTDDELNDLVNRIKGKANTEIDEVVSTLPNYGLGIFKWAVRSLIALGAAYGIDAWFGGPSWLIPAAWIYIPISLVLTVGIAFYANRIVLRARQQVETAANNAEQHFDEDHQD